MEQENKQKTKQTKTKGKQRTRKEKSRLVGIKYMRGETNLQQDKYYLYVLQRKLYLKTNV